MAEHWDKDARKKVTEARDILREHYRDKPHTDKHDLAHCENAIAAMKDAERAALIEKAKARVTGRKAREEKERGKDEGREH